MIMSKLTLIKPAPQKTKIANQAVTVSIYFWFLAILAVGSKFAHYPFLKNDIPGICGYTWMSSFIYAIGGVVTTMSLALILLIVAPKTNQYKKALNILGALMLVSSCYFLLMVLIDKEWLLNYFGRPDLPVWAYRATLLVLGGLTAFVFYFFNRAAIFTERTLKAKIRALVDHVLDSEEHYLALATKAAAYEEYYEPIDGVSWKEQVSAMEVANYEVLNYVSL